jgi:hypothetical protein
MRCIDCLSEAVVVTCYWPDGAPGPSYCGPCWETEERNAEAMHAFLRESIEKLSL